MPATVLCSESHVPATVLCSESHKSISQCEVLRVGGPVCCWELKNAICDFAVKTFCRFTQQNLYLAWPKIDLSSNLRAHWLILSSLLCFSLILVKGK